MYIREEFAEAVAKSNLEVSDPQDWTSPAHKTVFRNICVCNPKVTRADQLLDNYRIINKIPTDKIEIITVGEIKKLGCVF